MKNLKISSFLATLIIMLFVLPLATKVHASYLDMIAPLQWPETRQKIFNQKITAYNANGCIANTSLKSRELAVILENHDLGAEWICFRDRSLAAFPQAIVGEETTVFRGMKIDDTTLSDIFKRGLESPFMYKHRVDPDSMVDILAITDLSYHSGQGSSASTLISTSLDFDVATAFAGKNGYILEISLPANKGIALNTLLGDHAYKHEKEISVAFYLPAHNIFAAYKVENGKVKKTVLNPHHN